MGRLEKAGVAAEDVVGNVAIVNNFSPSLKNGSRFWFSDWRVSGAKVEAHRERAFGPILWSMHTVSDSRGPEGTVLKMTAQMPPVGAGDSDEVRLAVKRGGVWQEVGAAKIHPEARTATFRVARWDAGQAWPYRLAYTERDGADEREAYYEGVVRAEPKGRPLVIGGFTCQYHYGFPYVLLVRNVEFLNPDMLYFSGDQIYEPNGGYGIVQEPADRAILCFLRKWYMFGWAFGDVMRGSADGVSAGRS